MMSLSGIPLAPGLLQGLPAELDATRESWRLLEMPAAWVVVLVLVPLIGLVAAGCYWRERLAKPRRMVLMGLRFASLALLLIVLFRPVRVQHQESVEPAEVIVLIDDSASMSRKDAYVGDDKTRRVIEQATDLSAAQATRLELARAAVEQDLLPHLSDQGYQIRTFKFDDGFAPIADLSATSGRGHGTHVGDAVTSALSYHRGRHVTDLVVVSDGRSTGGTPLLEAAAGARAAGIPVHTIVVGDTRPERNLVVELVEAPPSVLEGDEVAISVRVHARGVEEGGTAEVILEELEGDDGENARTVTSETVDLDQAGERIVLVAPEAGGGISGSERRFRVSVAPLEDERMLDDNSLDVRIHVTPEKIRVLYIDGYPRYEYRFLRSMLLRSDERIVAQIWLESATPDFPQERSRGLPALKRPPSERREILDNYDVILIGDVNPYNLFADPARGQEFVASLFEFVERGGGLCFIAGEWQNPKALAGTELAKLLPVQLDPTGSLEFDNSTETEYRPTIEDPANPHEIVRLHPNVDTNRRLWEDEGGLRGFFWYYPVAGAKPGSQVLLRHPERSLSSAEERDPLLVAGYYPSGRTLFLAIDSTWLWQYRFVHRYHERFWRNAIRWLALGRLKSGDRRFGLEPLRTQYSLDERVTLEARVLDEDYRPSAEGAQDAWLEGPDGDSNEIALNLVDGRPGLFRGTFDAERPGHYRSWIEVGGQRMVSTEFEVVLPSRENADPSPDPAAMAELAQLTLGVAVGLGELETVRAEFPGGEERREPISSQLEDAWDNWSTLLIALALLSLEWILRKRYELI